MNTNTGEIFSGKELGGIINITDFNDLKEALEQNRDFVSVSEADMTEKQKETKQVSLKDHRSKLGRQLTAERKIRRNEPCPCGSGKKFKYCCRNK